VLIERRNKICLIIETIQASPYKHLRMVPARQQIKLGNSIGYVVEGLVSRCLTVSENGGHEGVVALNVYTENSLLGPVDGGQWYFSERPVYLASLTTNHLPSGWESALPDEKELLLKCLLMAHARGEERLHFALKKLSELGIIRPGIKSGLDLGKHGRAPIGTLGLVAKLAGLSLGSVCRLMKESKAG